MKKLLTLLVCVQILGSNMAFAQQEDEFIKNTQTDLMIVAGAGAGGAILGLSTLSFYDKPSKHVSNIWTGAALGVIAGVVYVAINSAQRGTEDLISKVPSSDFSTAEREKFHLSNNRYFQNKQKELASDFLTLNF